MADEHHLPFHARLAQGAGDALIARPDIVDAGDVAAVEKAHGFLIGAVAVVADLGGAGDAHLGKLLAEDRAEPHLAFLVAAIGKRADEHGDLVLSRRQEPAQQQAGQPPGGAVVDPDIADLVDSGDV